MNTLGNEEVYNKELENSNLIDEYYNFIKKKT